MSRKSERCVVCSTRHALIRHHLLSYRVSRSAVAVMCRWCEHAVHGRLVPRPGTEGAVEVYQSLLPPQCVTPAIRRVKTPRLKMLGGPQALRNPESGTMMNRTTLDLIAFEHPLLYETLREAYGLPRLAVAPREDYIQRETVQKADIPPVRA